METSYTHTYLPEDIIYDIIQELPLEDILNLCQTNTYYNIFCSHQYDNYWRRQLVQLSPSMSQYNSVEQINEQFNLNFKTFFQVYVVFSKVSNVNTINNLMTTRPNIAALVILNTPIIPIDSLLIDLIRSGNLELIKSIINTPQIKKYISQAVQSHRSTPIEIALRNNHPEIALYLMDNGYNYNTEYPYNIRQDIGWTLRTNYTDVLLRILDKVDFNSIQPQIIAHMVDAFVSQSNLFGLNLSMLVQYLISHNLLDVKLLNYPNILLQLALRWYEVGEKNPEILPIIDTLIQNKVSLRFEQFMGYLTPDDITLTRILLSQLPDDEAEFYEYIVNNDLNGVIQTQDYVSGKHDKNYNNIITNDIKLAIDLDRLDIVTYLIQQHPDTNLTDIYTDMYELYGEDWAENNESMVYLQRLGALYEPPSPEPYDSY